MKSTKEGFVISCILVKGDKEHKVYVCSDIFSKKLFLSSDIHEAAMYNHNAKNKMICLNHQQARNGIILHGKRVELFGTQFTKFEKSFDFIDIVKEITIKDK
ncbi:MAG: hypothetical protein ACRC92_18820 [Peptostreptococcaceae bacterium]